MKYLLELRARLTAFAGRLRLRGAHGEQLETEVCLEVLADAEHRQTLAAREAYTAQQADLEAERLLLAAQAESSPGGATITPGELRPILRQIRNSARHDAAIADQLATS